MDAPLRPASRAFAMPVAPDRFARHRSTARTRAFANGGIGARPSESFGSHACGGSPAVWFGIALGALLAADVARAQSEPDRGAALYENHCGDCHGLALHRRETPRVRSREELHTWVTAWSVHASSPWSVEDIESVTRYLSREVYGFTR